MAAPLTTKPQVNGYRFLVRRLQHALMRRDPRMIHDPMRSQNRSVMVGLALAILVLLGCGILALLRPQGSVGDASIVLAKDSGALYVRVGDRLHPVLNLASARLIVGEAASPASVKDDKLGEYPRGPMLGIPGAPAALDTGGGNPDWTVCDRVADGTVTTGVVAGPTNAAGARDLGPGQSALVEHDGDTYLLYEGRAAEVDTSDTTLMRVLGLSGATARPVSSGVLDALEDSPPLTVPEIDGGGEAGPGALSAYPVGSIVRVPDAAGDRYHLILRDGVQPVPVTAAEAMRAVDSVGQAEVPEISPDRLSGVTMVEQVPLSHFPTAQPEVLDVAGDPVTCVRWHRADGDPEAELTLLAGRDLPLPDGVTAAPLAGADGGGPHTDWFASPSASGWYVQVTDSQGESRREGPVGYVTATGIRHGIPDTATAGVLGLGETPTPVPWSIDRLLAPGPMLSRETALVAHDGVGPSADPVPMVLQGG